MSAHQLNRPSNDARGSTTSLIVNIAMMLEEAGCGSVASGADLVRLEQALFGFLNAAAATLPAETHPAWCDRDSCDTQGHLSRRIPAGHQSDQFGVDVALARLECSPEDRITALELGITDDGSRQSWLLSLAQARDLGSALTMLQRWAAIE